MTPEIYLFEGLGKNPQIVEAMPPSSPVRRGFEAWMDKHLGMATELGVDAVGLPIS